MEKIKNTKYNIDRDGFVGELFVGDKYPEKVVIRPGGAGMKREDFTAASEFLADAGFSVLIIGLYLWDGMSRDAAFIPIDYVERAIAAAKRDIALPRMKFAICGYSLGASYSLAAASVIPEISRVAAASPFDYVMEACKNLKPLGISSFCFRGKELPFVKLRILDYDLLRLMIRIKRDKSYGSKRALRYIYDHTPLNDEAAVPVENMHADVLLLASENDDLWPSGEAVRRMSERLEKNNYAYEVRTHIYDKGSHILGISADLSSKKNRFLYKNLEAFKNDPDGAKEALLDSLEKIISFLKEM